MAEKIDNIPEINRYLQELKKYSSYDLCEYSGNSIYRRVNKVLNDHNLDLPQLIDRTKTDSLFAERIVQEITVNTTEFFRDPELWHELITNHYLRFKGREDLIIWHAGCSSGQEVYSNEVALNELGLLDDSFILATDLNNKMLNIAQKGIFNYKLNRKHLENFDFIFNRESEAKHVSFEKYFAVDKNNNSVKVNKLMKIIPVFYRQDLVKEELPGYMKFDIIFCRNVLIYFNAKLQAKILQQFYDRLNEGGILILGAHEGLNGFFKTKFTKNGQVFIKNSALRSRH